MTRSRAGRASSAGRGAATAAAFLGAVTVAGAANAEADRPMYYLETFGSPGHEIASLTWGLIWLSVAVVVIVSVLVLFGVLLKGRRVPNMRADYTAVRRPDDRKALRWVFVGLALTVAALTFFVVWTMDTLAAIRAPAEVPGVTIRITAHQWWWEVEYHDEDNPARNFETANEIHVPVGEPVKIELNSADVIHSFWVPSLGGKTDAIPGQTNVMWLQADVPGVFRGQCVEYCGKQHAHMALRLFADPPEQFLAWWDHQLEPVVPEPVTAEAKLGADLFRLNCSACHAVRGMLAGGQMGPNLSHLMLRTTIASGMLPNTPGHLSGWIANPDRLKPGTKMPRTDLSGPELDAIRAFLTTLE